MYQHAPREREGTHSLAEVLLGLLEKCSDSSTVLMRFFMRSCDITSHHITSHHITSHHITSNVSAP